MNDSHLNREQEAQNSATIPSCYTDVPISYPSQIRQLQSNNQTSHHCLITRPQSEKRILSKQISSEKLKKNLLQSRYSQRMRNLKQITRTNLQMFLRIQSQESHYSLAQSEVKKNKIKLFPSKKEEIQSSSECDSGIESQKSYRLRCKSANLLRKCEVLKETIVKDKENRISSLTTYSEDKKNEMNEKKVRFVRAGSAFNKENQVHNQSKHLLMYQNKEQTEKMILKKKLGFEGVKFFPFKQRISEHPHNFYKKQGLKNTISSKLIIIENTNQKLQKQRLQQQMFPRNI